MDDSLRNNSTKSHNNTRYKSMYIFGVKGLSLTILYSPGVLNGNNSLCKTKKSHHDYSRYNMQ